PQPDLFFRIGLELIVVDLAPQGGEYAGEDAFFGKAAGRDGDEQYGQDDGDVESPCIAGESTPVSLHTEHDADDDQHDQPGRHCAADDYLFAELEKTDDQVDVKGGHQDHKAAVKIQRK